MSLGSSSQTPQQSTATKDPWAPSQPYLQQAMGAAANLYNNGVGYAPYMGTTQAPIDQFQQQGLGALIGFSQQNINGPPGIATAQNEANQVIGAQGITPGIQSALGQMGAVGTNLGALYQQSQQQDPYLASILATNNRQIADKVASQMSGAGRYGSGQYTDVLTRALAESANPILAQDWQRQQQMGQSIAQQQQSLYGQMAGIYGQGLNQAGQYAQILPSLASATYIPAQMEAQAGQVYTDRAQAALDDAIRQYNVGQAWPWEQVARLNAIATGTGGLGGQTVTATTPYQPGLGQSILGGALAGGGLFGPIGAAGGAALGGLLR